MQIRVEAPPEVQEYIMKNESFSGSGNIYHGEGGDYITETENKHIKGHQRCTVYCTLSQNVAIKPLFCFQKVKPKRSKSSTKLNI